MSVSQTQQGETTYHGHTQTVQPPRYHSKCCREVYQPRRRHGRIKSAPTNISRTGTNGNTYQICASAVQPLPNDSKHSYMVIGPRRRHGWMKSQSRNVSRTEGVKNTYLGHIIAIWSIRRPKKIIKRLNELTFEYRMQGESWRDVKDYG